MKKLTGIYSGRLAGECGRFECDEITVELDHKRVLTIRRESVKGEGGITLFAGFSQDEKTANARFVVRPTNFGILNLTIEQAK